MLLYELRLALLSFRRTPTLTALMIGAIAVGIAASMITITLYHARSGNPIWWKNDRLHAVTLDARSLDQEMNRRSAHPEYPPFQLTYRDAQALFRSELPTRQAMMFKGQRLVDPEHSGLRPFSTVTRLTTADFFAMFDVPFLYGGPWSGNADTGPEAVLVLGRRLNERLFNGANSVGRTLSVGGRNYRVVGVMDNWMPQPKFYDLNTSGFEAPEELFMPFRWGELLEIAPIGGLSCMRSNTDLSSYRAMLNAECVWIQYWAEFATDEQRERYQQFIDGYVNEQKKFGRFPRPLNNRLANVSEWLAMNDVVGNESRILVAVALMFLAVCVLNTLGMMLAKFLGAAAVSGVRRALGASRLDIMRQHLVEVMVIALVGGALGLVLASAGLWAVRQLLYLPLAASSGNATNVEMARAITHLDGEMVLAALAVSLLTGLVAGLYPAWRIGRAAPAVFLKTQ